MRRRSSTPARSSRRGIATPPERPERELGGERVPQRRTPQHGVTLPPDLDPPDPVGDGRGMPRPLQGAAWAGRRVEAPVRDEHGAARDLLVRLAGREPRRQCGDRDHVRAPGDGDPVRPPIEWPTSTTGTSPYRSSICASAHSASATGERVSPFQPRTRYCSDHTARPRSPPAAAEPAGERPHAPDRELAGRDRLGALLPAAVQHECGRGDARPAGGRWIDDVERAGARSRPSGEPTEASVPSRPRCGRRHLKAGACARPIRAREHRRRARDAREQRAWDRSGVGESSWVSRSCSRSPARRVAPCSSAAATPRVSPSRAPRASPSRARRAEPGPSATRRACRRRRRPPTTSTTPSTTTTQAPPPLPPPPVEAPPVAGAASSSRAAAAGSAAAASATAGVDVQRWRRRPRGRGARGHERRPRRARRTVLERAARRVRAELGVDDGRQPLHGPLERRCAARARRASTPSARTCSRVRAGMSAEAMESAWMASPSHRANILGGFVAAGVGIAQGADGQLYVAVAVRRLTVPARW